jgi:hypothetical protein
MADLDPRAHARVERVHGEPRRARQMDIIVELQTFESARKRTLRMKIPFGRRDDLVIDDALGAHSRTVQEQPSRGLDRRKPFAVAKRDGLDPRR